MLLSLIYFVGMHELLAPVLYVLQFDVECLLEVRKLYEDHFTDRFDGLFCQENDLSYSFDFRKSSDLMEDEINSNGNATKIKSLDELDPKIQNIVLLSDAYGAEGELGVVLSLFCYLFFLFASCCVLVCVFVSFLFLSRLCSCCCSCF